MGRKESESEPITIKIAGPFCEKVLLNLKIISHEYTMTMVLFIFLTPIMQRGGFDFDFVYVFSFSSSSYRRSGSSTLV